MRLASLSPAVTEILYALELEADIVCTDQFSDWPTAAKSLPHLRDHQQIDVTALQQYRPDIVFTSTVVQEQLSRDLQLAGLTVVHQDPRTIHGVYDSIRSLGMMLDREQLAAECIRGMQQQFNDVKRKAGLLPQRPRVYIEEWHHPPMVSGNWVPEIIRLSGGETTLIQTGELSCEVQLETVQAFDPDLIVLSICGAGQAAEASLLTDRQGWSDLRAVQSGALRVLDDSLLNRPGPRLPEGAHRLYGWLFELLH